MPSNYEPIVIDLRTYSSSVLSILAQLRNGRVDSYHLLQIFSIVPTQLSNLSILNFPSNRKKDFV